MKTQQQNKNTKTINVRKKIIVELCNQFENAIMTTINKHKNIEFAEILYALNAAQVGIWKSVHEHDCDAPFKIRNAIHK